MKKDYVNNSSSRTPILKQKKQSNLFFNEKKSNIGSITHIESSLPEKVNMNEYTKGIYITNPNPLTAVSLNDKILIMGDIKLVYDKLNIEFNEQIELDELDKIEKPLEKLLEQSQSSMLNFEENLNIVKII